MKIDKSTLYQIEIAFGIKLYDWQKAYLLDEPILSGMRMTGRCTGKTFAYILKKLLSTDEPLIISPYIREFSICDWWSIERERQRIDNTNYQQWFFGELISIHLKLKEYGIPVREVIPKFR